MALKGYLEIEGVTEHYTVLECEYYFNQRVNPNNGLPQCGLEASQITVTIVSPAKGRPLYDWMMEEFHYLNGQIRLITNVNSHRPAIRYVWFENAKCVHLYEYFNGQNSVMMTTRLTIQPAKMGMIDGVHLDETNIGYDFRHRRRTVELPKRDKDNKIRDKFKMDSKADRNNDYIDQINNDPYYDQFQ